MLPFTTRSSKSSLCLSFSGIHLTNVFLWQSNKSKKKRVLNICHWDVFKHSLILSVLEYCFMCYDAVNNWNHIASNGTIICKGSERKQSWLNRCLTSFLLEGLRKTIKYSTFEWHCPDRNSNQASRNKSLVPCRLTRPISIWLLLII